MRDLALSVVICTYNRAALLKSCLESLVSLTEPEGGYEIIVVLNNCTDESESVVECFAPGFSELVHLKEQRQGLSYARNAGIARARGRYIAFIDDDASADADWAVHIVAAFETREPRPAAVGGMAVPVLPKGLTAPVWYDDVLELRTWGEQARYLEGDEAIYGFYGMNMAFRRELFDRYGGFSTDFGLVGGRVRMGEDTEFFVRISRHNEPLFYDPEIKVIHMVNPEHLRMSARLKRAFRTGQALRSIEGVSIVSSTWVTRAAKWVAFPIKGAVRILIADRPRVESVQVLWDWALRAGYIWPIS
jgi:glycosyltransferase involved in cell wall biosynthesis